MNSRNRVIGTCIALGGIALLGGCVGVPTGPSYGSVYSEPYYYSDPSPVVVSPQVYIDGGYGYSSGPRYYGRPGYSGPRGGYGPRPGYVPRSGYDQNPGRGGRPQAAVPRPPRGAGAQASPPLFRTPRNSANMITSPDSRNATPP